MNIHSDAGFHHMTQTWPNPAREAPRERLRRPWIYAACASFFCLELVSIAAVAGEGKFIAKATIISVINNKSSERDAGGKLPRTFPQPALADGSQSQHPELPFSSKVPEAVLRAVVETEGLADDPEFVSPRWIWIARAHALSE